MNYKILVPKDKDIIARILNKLSSMGYSVGKNTYKELTTKYNMDVLCVNTVGFVNEDGTKFPKDYSVLMEESDIAFKTITDEVNKELFAFCPLSEEEIDYYNDFEIVSWNDFLDDSFEDAGKKEIFEFTFENEYPFKGSFRWINNGNSIMEINKKTITNRMEFIQGVIDLIEREVK